MSAHFFHQYEQLTCHTKGDMMRRPITMAATTTLGLALLFGTAGVATAEKLQEVDVMECSEGGGLIAETPNSDQHECFGGTYNGANIPGLGVEKGPSYREEFGGDHYDSKGQCTNCLRSGYQEQIPRRWN